MIENPKGKVAFLCDLAGCHEAIETGEGDFKEASAVAKDEGWEFRKRGEVWKHFCCGAHESMDYRGEPL